MINYNPLKTHVNFGARYKYENKENPAPPYNTFFIQYGQTTLPEEQRQTSDEDVKSLHNYVVDYIKQTSLTQGPIDPTLEKGESIEEEKKIERIKVPDNIKDININADEDVAIRLRKAGGLFTKEFGKDLDNMHKRIMPMKEDSPEFVDGIIDFNKFMTRNYEVDMNTENKRLEKLVRSNEPTIFMVDHYSPPFDGSTVFTFLSEYYKTCKKLDENGECPGLKKDCPRPRLILNRSISDNFPEKLKEVGEKVMMQGVEVPLIPTVAGARENLKALDNLTQGLVDGKNHIIIYPEGRNTLFHKNTSLQERFQPGVVRIIQKALEEKGRVKIVPLGAFGNPKLGALHIGDPLYFEKEDNKVKVSGGNITPDDNAYKTNSFYRKMADLDEDESITICQNGRPVETDSKKDSKLMSRLISGILCTDLGICAQKAKDTVMIDS